MAFSDLSEETEEKARVKNAFIAHRQRKDSARNGEYLQHSDNRLLPGFELPIKVRHNIRIITLVPLQLACCIHYALRKMLTLSTITFRVVSCAGIRLCSGSQHQLLQEQVLIYLETSRQTGRDRN